MKLYRNWMVRGDYMTTSLRIVDEAIFYFAKHGYEGTTLSQIANEVGVKTPSLYAHFKSKEDIFFACLESALENDHLFFEEYLNRQDISLNKLLYSIILEYEDRLRNNPMTMFCLRMLYFPPHDFKEHIILNANQRDVLHGKLLYSLFEHARHQGHLQNITTSEAIEAYLCLFDGLMIELLYAGSERFQRRLAASWHVYSLGIFNLEKINN
jgi:AcrR family transcriptional regulator